MLEYNNVLNNHENFMPNFGSVFKNNLELNNENNNKKTDYTSSIKNDNFHSIHSRCPIKNMISPLRENKIYTSQNFEYRIGKINNSASPYSHLEFAPTAKEHNYVRDNLSAYTEAVLKNRNLNKEIKNLLK